MFHHTSTPLSPLYQKIIQTDRGLGINFAITFRQHYKKEIRMLKTMLGKIKNNHMLLMVLCCTAPILGFFILSFVGLKESWGYYALFLLCPIAHIFMMKGMKSYSHGQNNPQKPKQIEFK
jgi:hypothetical protein